MNKLLNLTLTFITVMATAPAAAQTRSPIAGPTGAVTGFGTSVVMLGNEVFVGRPGEMSMFPMPASQVGGVHVFHVSESGDWTETAIISPPNGVPGDGFGTAVAVSGDLMAVGAPRHRSGRGAVHLFRRSGGSWSHVAAYENSSGEATDRLGRSVAFSGSNILVGVPGRSSGTGAVVVLELANGMLSATHAVTATGGAANDQFGSAMALDGNWLVVGAPGPAGISLVGLSGQPKPGAAFVFRRGERPGEWIQQGVLQSLEQGVMALGQSVAFFRGGVAVSAPLSSGFAGGVHIFVRTDAGEWVESAVLRPEPSMPGSMFGYAVAGGENEILVGAPLPSGSVYAFVPGQSGGWVQGQRLAASLKGMTVFQGGAIAVSGNRAVIGAPGADFFQGVGVLFMRDVSGRWTERSTLVDDLPGFEAVAGGQVDCEDGSARMFGCEDVDLVSFLPLKDLGAARGTIVNDVWGWTDSLTGKDYAIVGRSDGTVFIDVTAPELPVYLGVLPLTEGATVNIWRDIKVYRNHAFIVADAAGAHGVQIFDLTRLRNVTNPPAKFQESARYNGIFSAHNIVINERTGFAYSVGSSGGGETCGGGLHMIDIRQPTEPKFAGCFSDPTTGNASTGYSHDAQCIIYRGPDVAYTGREICFGSNETALSIADVTDKENPIAVSSGSYPNVSYAHQGWVTDDHRHFFMNDELDELAGATPRTRTLVWDVEDLDDPVLLMEYLGSTQSSDHNLYIRDDYMYQSNYVSGLRIVDVSDPANPAEVGHFDTVPFGEDAPGFAGSWSNFPFFDSGVIVVTSMWEGVFILKKRDTRPIP